jgi:hypothetical protein
MAGRCRGSDGPFLLSRYCLSEGPCKHGPPSCHSPPALNSGSAPVPAAPCAVVLPPRAATFLDASTPRQGGGAWGPASFVSAGEMKHQVVIPSVMYFVCLQVARQGWAMPPSARKCPRLGTGPNPRASGFPFVRDVTVATRDARGTVRSTRRRSTFVLGGRRFGFPGFGGAKPPTGARGPLSCVRNRCAVRAASQRHRRRAGTRCICGKAKKNRLTAATPWAESASRANRRRAGR